MAARYRQLVMSTNGRPSPPGHHWADARDHFSRPFGGIQPGVNKLDFGLANRLETDGSEAWSVDRLGRSVQDLVSFLNEIHASGVNLYLHQQGLDTTTPSGRAMFQMMGVFAEFERAMIRERVLSGMARAREKGTKSGKAIGRPRLDPERREAIRATYRSGGIGLRGVARRYGVSVETVRRCLAE